MSAHLKYIDERQPTDGDEIPLSCTARVAVMKGGHDQVVDSQSVPCTLRYKLAKLRDSGIRIPAAGRAILLAAGRAPQTF